MLSSGVPVYQQSMQQLDGNELHVCPYDASHRVAAKRFVRHIIKCRKNHPGADTSVCPFNARHIVPKPELQIHISSCLDRRMIENEINCERLNIDGDEARGDTSVPPYSGNDVHDWGEDEDWDREIAATETQRPNYRTQTPSNRYVWNSSDANEEGENNPTSASKYATQTSQPFPMERRPVGPPQLRSGVVGLGRGRIRNPEAGDQKKSREPGNRPGPSGGASLAANFNMQPRTATQPRHEPNPSAQSRPTVSRRPMRPPAYRNLESVDDTLDEEIRQSLATIE